MRQQPASSSESEVPNSMAPDWDKVRSEFPSLEHWTFLNTATFGQLPRRAADAVSRHFARRDGLACSDFLDWFDDADGLRRSLATLVGALPDDIAFFPSATAALSLLVGGIEWRPGDRIVTLEHEFPNNLYYPALLEARQVEFVETAWEGFHAALTPATRLVAVSMLNYTTGFRAPLDEIAGLVAGRGALFFVDGTQGLGALQLDLSRLRISMLAAHGYKWLLSPTGAGFAYVAPELRKKLAPNQVGWRSHHAWREVNHLHHGAPDFKSEAEKYEGSMLPFPCLYAMQAAVGLILELGPAAVEERVLDLAAKLRAMLKQLGATLPSGDGAHFDNSPIVAARFPHKDAAELVRLLKQRRILVSARHGNLRISVHFYNNEQDLERLGTALGALL